MDMSINSTPNMFQPTLHNHYRKKSSLNYRKTVHTHSIKFVKIFFCMVVMKKKEEILVKISSRFYCTIKYTSVHSFFGQSLSNIP